MDATYTINFQYFDLFVKRHFGNDHRVAFSIKIMSGLTIKKKCK